MGLEVSVIDLTRSGPHTCPVCKKQCVTVPDTLTGGMIAVHRYKKRPKGGYEFASRCIIPAEPEESLQDRADRLADQADDANDAARYSE